VKLLASFFGYLPELLLRRWLQLFADDVTPRPRETTFGDRKAMVRSE
jgi:hypothetical protein